MELHLNFIAIIVSTVANFVLGALWYMPLFGKAWAKEMKLDTSVKPEKSVMMKGMAFMVIGNFLFAFVFAHNIAAWQFVPEIPAMGNLVNAFMAAMFTWVGFYVPGNLGATVWENKSWKLVSIDAGYQLASLLLVAFILTYWK